MPGAARVVARISGFRRGEEYVRGLEGGPSVATCCRWPGRVSEVGDGLLTLFLCGDVMTGRGVDQVLPHPGDPELRERYAGDARAYVRLAERAHGRIPRQAGFGWPWGDALPVLEDVAPDVRVINLETSITRSRDFAPGKAIHYRMSPGNVPCLAAARPDACALANNHVLDFGRRGLQDTLDAVSGAGLRAVGAGRDADQARRPAAVPVPGGGRVVIFSCGTASSGIPPGWAAAPGRPGVDLLPDLSDATADDVIGRARAAKRPGDVVVVSVHWGSNWGYAVAPDQVRFAHRLIGGGVDLIHGHSSHHPGPVEVFGGKLVLYGCGDCINDNEGITGHERTGVTCGCCTSRRCSRARARQRPCGWRPCRPGDCGCTAPRRRTPGGWGR